MNANENDSAFRFMKNIPLPIIQEKNMNQRIERLLESAPYTTISTEGRLFTQKDMAVFAQLLLANLAEELSDVSRRSKQTNPEWANGVDHAAMLAQRMTMALPQWPEAE